MEHWWATPTASVHMGEVLRLHSIYSEVDRTCCECHLFRHNRERPHDFYTKNVCSRLSVCQTLTEAVAEYKAIKSEIKPDIYTAMIDGLGALLLELKQEKKICAQVVKSPLIPRAHATHHPTDIKVTRVASTLASQKERLLNAQNIEFDFDTVEKDATFFTNISEEIREIIDEFKSSTKTYREMRYRKRMVVGSALAISVTMVGIVIAKLG